MVRVKRHKRKVSLLNDYEFRIDSGIQGINFGFGVRARSVSEALKRVKQKYPGKNGYVVTDVKLLNY